MSEGNELDFSMAVVDGIFLKPLVHALGCMDVETFFFRVTSEGISLNQPNKHNGSLFVSWEAAAEDFIFFDYESPHEETQVTVMAGDLEKALKSVQKKKSVMLFKYHDHDQLKISISETIKKPDRHHFPNSISVPLQKLMRPDMELSCTRENENHPIVAAEATHVCEEFQRIVLKHDDKKGGLRNFKVRIIVHENAVIVLDPVETEDGFHIGVPNGPPVGEFALPLHLFREMKKLGSSAPDFSLVKFYHEDEILMIKCCTGNYGTLRLYYTQNA